MKIGEWRFDFDFLFYKDGDSVIAHCLQTGTAAYGPTVQEAKRALRRALECEIDAALEDKDLPRIYDRPAPEELWSQINEAVRQEYVLEMWSIAKADREKVEVRCKDFILEDAAA